MPKSGNVQPSAPDYATRDHRTTTFQAANDAMATVGIRCQSRRAGVYPVLAITPITPLPQWSSSAPRSMVGATCADPITRPICTQLAYQKPCQISKLDRGPDRSGSHAMVAVRQRICTDLRRFGLHRQIIRKNKANAETTALARHRCCRCYSASPPPSRSPHRCGVRGLRGVCGI